jgi:hypothetical protein
MVGISTGEAPKEDVRSFSALSTNKSVSTTLNTMIKAGGSDLLDHYKFAPSVYGRKHA